MSRLTLLRVALLSFVAGCALPAREGPSEADLRSAPMSKAGDAEVRALIDPATPKVTGNTVWVQITEKGTPWSGTPEVLAIMPAMGAMAEMRSPADVHEVAPGLHGGSLDLAMGGSWSLVVRAGPDEARFSFTVGSPGLSSEAGSGGVQIDPVRRQEFGIRTAEVRSMPLSVSIRAPGRVAFAENAEQDFVSRVSGTIVELGVDRTGARVASGQVLARLHSPELETAQREHVLAAQGGNAEVVEASRARLRRLGLLNAQIEALEAWKQPPDLVELRAPAGGVVVTKDVVEGASLMPGMRLYRLARPEKVWVEADLYQRDVPHVQVGAAATVRTLEGVEHKGRVDLVYPQVDAMTRTRIARITVEDPGSDLVAGSLVEVTVREDKGERLVVPDTAVLYSGPRRIVFVDRGAEGLVPVEVTVGANGDGVLEVTSGLLAGEEVVSSGTFLVAAENRLKSSTELWEAPHEHHP